MHDQGDFAVFVNRHPVAAGPVSELIIVLGHVILDFHTVAIQLGEAEEGLIAVRIEHIRVGNISDRAVGVGDTDHHTVEAHTPIVMVVQLAIFGFHTGILAQDQCIRLLDNFDLLHRAFHKLDGVGIGHMTQNTKDDLIGAAQALDHRFDRAKSVTIPNAFIIVHNLAGAIGISHLELDILQQVMLGIGCAVAVIQLSCAVDPGQDLVIQDFDLGDGILDGFNVIADRSVACRQGHDCAFIGFLGLPIQIEVVNHVTVVIEDMLGHGAVRPGNLHFQASQIFHNKALDEFLAGRLIGDLQARDHIHIVGNPEADLAAVFRLLVDDDLTGLASLQLHTHRSLLVQVVAIAPDIDLIAALALHPECVPAGSFGNKAQVHTFIGFREGHFHGFIQNQARSEGHIVHIVRCGHNGLQAGVRMALTQASRTNDDRLTLGHSPPQAGVKVIVVVVCVQLVPLAVVDLQLCIHGSQHGEEVLAILGRSEGVVGKVVDLCHGVIQVRIQRQLAIDFGHGNSHNTGRGHTVLEGRCDGSSAFLHGYDTGTGLVCITEVHHGGIAAGPVGNIGQGGHGIHQTLQINATVQNQLHFGMVQTDGIDRVFLLELEGHGNCAFSLIGQQPVGGLIVALTGEGIGHAVPVDHIAETAFPDVQVHIIVGQNITVSHSGIQQHSAVGFQGKGQLFVIGNIMFLGFDYRVGAAAGSAVCQGHSYGNITVGQSFQTEVVISDLHNPGHSFVVHGNREGLAAVEGTESHIAVRDFAFQNHAAAVQIHICRLGGIFHEDGAFVVLAILKDLRCHEISDIGLQLGNHQSSAFIAAVATPEIGSVRIADSQSCIHAVNIEEVEARGIGSKSGDLTAGGGNADGGALVQGHGLGNLDQNLRGQSLTGVVVDIHRVLGLLLQVVQPCVVGAAANRAGTADVGIQAIGTGQEVIAGGFRSECRRQRVAACQFHFQNLAELHGRILQNRNMAGVGQDGVTDGHGGSKCAITQINTSYINTEEVIAVQFHSIAFNRIAEATGRECPEGIEPHRNRDIVVHIAGNGFRQNQFSGSLRLADLHRIGIKIIPVSHGQEQLLILLQADISVVTGLIVQTFQISAGIESQSISLIQPDDINAVAGSSEGQEFCFLVIQSHIINCIQFHRGGFHHLQRHGRGQTVGGSHGDCCLTGRLAGDPNVLVAGFLNGQHIRVYRPGIGTLGVVRSATNIKLHDAAYHDGIVGITLSRDADAVGLRDFRQAVGTVKHFVCVVITQYQQIFDACLQINHVVGGMEILLRIPVSGNQGEIADIAVLLDQIVSALFHLQADDGALPVFQVCIHAFAHGDGSGMVNNQGHSAVLAQSVEDLQAVGHASLQLPVHILAVVLIVVAGHMAAVRVADVHIDAQVVGNRIEAGGFGGKCYLDVVVCEDRQLLCLTRDQSRSFQDRDGAGSGVAHIIFRGDSCRTGLQTLKDRDGRAFTHPANRTILAGQSPIHRSKGPGRTEVCHQPDAGALVDRHGLRQGQGTELALLDQHLGGDDVIATLPIHPIGVHTEGICATAHIVPMIHLIVIMVIQAVVLSIARIFAFRRIHIHISFGTTDINNEGTVIAAGNGELEVTALAALEGDLILHVQLHHGRLHHRNGDTGLQAGGGGHHQLHGTGLVGQVLIAPVFGVVTVQRQNIRITFDGEGVILGSVNRIKIGMDIEGVAHQHRVVVTIHAYSGGCGALGDLEVRIIRIHRPTLIVMRHEQVLLIGFQFDHQIVLIFPAAVAHHGILFVQDIPVMDIAIEGRVVDGQVIVAGGFGNELERYMIAANHTDAHVLIQAQDLRLGYGHICLDIVEIVVMQRQGVLGTLIAQVSSDLGVFVVADRFTAVGQRHSQRTFGIDPEGVPASLSGSKGEAIVRSAGHSNSLALVQRQGDGIHNIDHTGSSQVAAGGRQSCGTNGFTVHRTVIIAGTPQINRIALNIPGLHNRKLPHRAKFCGHSHRVADEGIHGIGQRHGGGGLCLHQLHGHGGILRVPIVQAHGVLATRIEIGIQVTLAIHFTIAPIAERTFKSEVIVADADHIVAGLRRLEAHGFIVGVANRDIHRFTHRNIDGRLESDGSSNGIAVGQGTDQSRGAGCQSMDPDAVAGCALHLKDRRIADGPGRILQSCVGGCQGERNDMGHGRIQSKGPVFHVRRLRIGSRLHGHGAVHIAAVIFVANHIQAGFHISAVRPKAIVRVVVGTAIHRAFFSDLVHPAAVIVVVGLHLGPGPVVVTGLRDFHSGNKRGVGRNDNRRLLANLDRLNALHLAIQRPTGLAVEARIVLLVGFQIIVGPVVTLAHIAGINRTHIGPYGVVIAIGFIHIHGAGADKVIQAGGFGGEAQVGNAVVAHIGGNSLTRGHLGLTINRPGDIFQSRAGLIVDPDGNGLTAIERPVVAGTAPVIHIDLQTGAVGCIGINDVLIGHAGGKAEHFLGTIGQRIDGANMALFHHGKLLHGGGIGHIVIGIALDHHPIPHIGFHHYILATQAMGAGFGSHIDHNIVIVCDKTVHTGGFRCEIERPVSRVPGEGTGNCVAHGQLHGTSKCHGVGLGFLTLAVEPQIVGIAAFQPLPGKGIIPIRTPVRAVLKRIAAGANDFVPAGRNGSELNDGVCIVDSLYIHGDTGHSLNRLGQLNLDRVGVGGAINDRNRILLTFLYQEIGVVIVIDPDQIIDQTGLDIGRITFGIVQIQDIHSGIVRSEAHQTIRTCLQRQFKALAQFANDLHRSHFQNEVLGEQFGAVLADHTALVDLAVILTGSGERPLCLGGAFHIHEVADLVGPDLPLVGSVLVGAVNFYIEGHGLAFLCQCIVGIGQDGQGGQRQNIGIIIQAQVADSIAGPGGIVSGIVDDYPLSEPVRHIEADGNIARKDHGLQLLAHGTLNIHHIGRNRHRLPAGRQDEQVPGILAVSGVQHAVIGGKLRVALRHGDGGQIGTMIKDIIGQRGHGSRNLDGFQTAAGKRFANDADQTFGQFDGLQRRTILEAPCLNRSQRGRQGHILQAAALAKHVRRNDRNALFHHGGNQLVTAAEDALIQRLHGSGNGDLGQSGVAKCLPAQHLQALGQIDGIQSVATGEGQTMDFLQGIRQDRVGRLIQIVERIGADGGNAVTDFDALDPFSVFIPGLAFVGFKILHGAGTLNAQNLVRAAEAPGNGIGQRAAQFLGFVTTGTFALPIVMIIGLNGFGVAVTATPAGVVAITILSAGSILSTLPLILMGSRNSICPGIAAIRTGDDPDAILGAGFLLLPGHIHRHAVFIMSHGYSVSQSLVAVIVTSTQNIGHIGFQIVVEAEVVSQYTALVIIHQLIHVSVIQEGFRIRIVSFRKAGKPIGAGHRRRKGEIHHFAACNGFRSRPHTQLQSRIAGFPGVFRRFGRFGGFLHRLRCAFHGQVFFRALRHRVIRKRGARDHADDHTQRQHHR